MDEEVTMTRREYYRHLENAFLAGGDAKRDGYVKVLRQMLRLRRTAAGTGPYSQTIGIEEVIDLLTGADTAE